MKRTAIVCLSATAMLTGVLSGCTDSKSNGGNKPADPDDKEAASAQVIAKFAAAWEKAWAPNGKPDEAAALTDAPTTFGPRLDGLDSALVARPGRSRPPATSSIRASATPTP